ncbi:hypothetical protein [Glycomyces paridis]|uniref:hypothetical protein n=1 Tax=Glycomyces paridis TaxID=2126555 RepID=UPI0013052200|nr:hypothetical protein [Glycomyces paridis]
MIDTIVNDQLFVNPGAGFHVKTVIRVLRTRFDLVIVGSAESKGDRGIGSINTVAAQGI